MKQLKNLNEVSQYIQFNHDSIFSKASGATSYKFLWLKNGNRSIIEYSDGFRISNMSVIKNKDGEECGLSIEQSFSGYALDFAKSYLKSKQIDKKITQKVVTYLNNLTVINIYDCMTELLSEKGLNLAYIDKKFITDVTIVDSWIRNKKMELRAQWYRTIDDFEKIMNLEKKEDGCQVRFIVL